MDKYYFAGNRQRLLDAMEPDSLVILFAGKEMRKTNDEYYPFFTQRNFLYLTGIDQKSSVFLAGKDSGGKAWQRLYILPGDTMAERWTGRRLKPQEAEEISGISDIRIESAFHADLQRLAVSGAYGKVYLDLFRQDPMDPDTCAHRFAQFLQKEYPFWAIRNANPIIRGLRTIKQPCEIQALRKAEEITKAGILAMMKAKKAARR